MEASIIREQQQHSVLREGIIAGILGGSAIALWFLIVDLAGRRPFYTPGVLGAGLLRVFGEPPQGESMFCHVLAYTNFHFAAFILLGMLAVVVVHWAEREPSVLAGVLILFVAFEVGSYGMVAMLAQASALGTLAWYQVGVANLIAAVLMGVYLWRTHPGLKQEFRYALEGKE